MKRSPHNFSQRAQEYLETLNGCFTAEHFAAIEHLASDLLEAWKKNRQVFICGNGGSAANALHISNDFHYGIGAAHHKEENYPGLRVEALTSNVAVISCLANDTGYENIYSNQLKVKANSSDLLIALSGSGNSPNIIKALESARELKMNSYAILAFDGGKSKDLADHAIHFKVNDMQIAEDTQLVIGHICMQWLNENNPQIGQ